jgi:hypothetical protein
VQDGLLHFYSTPVLKNDNELRLPKKLEKVQMLVAVTLFNEDYKALCKTLKGIHKNI